MTRIASATDGYVKVNRSLSNTGVVLGVFVLLATLLFLGLPTSQVVPTVQATKQSLRTLRSALDSYMLNTGAYPPSLESLTEGATPYLDKITKDAWQRPLIYLPASMPGKPFFLRSCGKDGRLGTSDDLDVWTVDF